MLAAMTGGGRAQGAAPNRIAERRLALGLTQAKLAELVGANTGTVSKLESGQLQLTQSWLERLAAALECREGDLLPANYLPPPPDGVVWAPVLSTADLARYEPKTLIAKAFPPVERVPVVAAHEEVYVSRQEDDSLDRRVPVGAALVVSFRPEDVAPLVHGAIYELRHQGRVIHRIWHDRDGPPRFEADSSAGTSRHPALFADAGTTWHVLGRVESLTASLLPN